MNTKEYRAATANYVEAVREYLRLFRERQERRRRFIEDFGDALEAVRRGNERLFESAGAAALDDLCVALGCPPERCERLDCRADIEFKFAAGAAQEGVFRGYGSVFNEPHETSSGMLSSAWKDQVAPGAFTKSLAEHKARGSAPAMLWQHDMSSPIGAWEKLQQTDRGLLCEGRLALATQKGAEAFELMKIGGMRGLSIGFSPAKYELDEKAKLRTLTEIKLFEISPVTIPADPSALVTDVKALRT